MGKMIRIAGFAKLLVVIGLAPGFCRAQPFHAVLDADAPGGFGPQRASSPWHRRQSAVGGLGFEVLVGDWPRLLQRGALDVFNRQHNREIYDYVAYQDLGQIRTAASLAKPRLVQRSWSTLHYSFGDGPESIHLTISRLTPALLCETRARTLSLFAGQKQGNRRRNDMTGTVPAYVAFPTTGGIAIRATTSAVSLAEMSQSWCLFWYGRSSHLCRTTIPNILARLDMPRFIQDGGLVASDLPVLVAFQHRPLELEPAEDGLQAKFGDRGGGAIAILPLFGFVHPRVSETEAWREGLPDSVVQRCRIWAQRMKSLPVSVAESYGIDRQGRVTVRQTFGFRTIMDAWGTEAHRMAPIPPMVSLCRDYGFPLQTPGERAPWDLATHSGPYRGILDAETVQWTVPSLDRYVRETAAWPAAETDAASALASELQQEVDHMIAADPLAPAGNVIGWLERHFKNPGETVLAVAEALPYLETAHPEAASKYRDYLLAFLTRHDPLTSDGLPETAGSVREYAPPDEVEPVRTVPRSLRWEDRANNVYAVWLAAQVTRDRSYVDAHWSQIRQIAATPRDWFDWTTCAYFRGPNEDRGSARAHRGEDRGSVWAANGQFARWIALARLARHRDDTELENQARYLLARTALVRFAQGRLNRFAYDRGLIAVDLAPDWMAKLSTSGGNGAGAGLLWTEHWSTAEDDVRTVLQWDEFGPILGQMLNHFWQPVIPHFQDLTPEGGRFLADYLPEVTRRAVAAVERNAPAWHLARRPAYVGKEMHFDSPRNACGIFLAKCYATGAGGAEMMRYQDIPFVRVGDLYHVRRLVANLRCFGGVEWEEVTP